MRLLTDRRFLIACFVGALPFLVAACFTPARGWAVTGLVVLGVLVALGCNSGDGRHPHLGDTERFLIGQLVRQGFGGAFRLDHLEHRITPGSAPDCVQVTFKATLTITEPLYQATVPPAEVCGTLTPRRIAALAKIANRVAEDSRDLPGIRALALPTDPYLRQYIQARSEQGWALTITGGARATHAASDGWNYSMTHAPKEFELLAQTGRPRAAFHDPVVLDASDGMQWLRDTLAAWAVYEEELNALRAAVDEQRARRGHDTVAAFFATHRAGMCYSGTGETMTQKIVPLPFLLELTSLDSEQHHVQFTLRRDRLSPHARRFTATVEPDHDTGHARLVAQTTAADAVPAGGPLLDAATAYTLEFSAETNGGTQLIGRGADFLLTLRESPLEALAALHKPSLDREREIWNAVAPGTGYGGIITAEGRAKRLLLVFLPSSQPGSLVAQLECDGWSGTFSVTRATAGPADATEYDLILETAAVPVTVGGVDEPTAEQWHRLQLQVNDRELTGLFEGVNGPVAVTLRR